MSSKYAARVSTAEIAPVAVVVWVCVPNALPVNVSAPTVVAAPVTVGTPAGQATVPEGVTVPVAFVPVAVSVCVCVPRAEPVNVCAETARLGAVALQAFAAPVPIRTLVAAQLPVVALAPFVPAGVPPLTAELVALDPVKTCALVVLDDPAKVGTPAGQAIAFKSGVMETVPLVPAGVPALTAELVTELPVKVGVTESAPPVVPTLPLAATVPRHIFPLRAETSVNPVGQVPEAMNMIAPEGNWEVNPSFVQVFTAVQK